MKHTSLVLLFLLIASCATKDKTTDASPITELSNPAAPYDTAMVPAPDPADTTMMAPAVVHQVNPTYPESAKKDTLEGTVHVQLLVTPAGDVSLARVIRSDNEVFNRASLEAAIQWKFEPPMKNAEAVAMWLTLPFRYKMSAE